MREPSASITKLYLDGNLIGDKIFETIAEVLVDRKICEHLDISNCCLTDKSCVLLGRLLNSTPGLKVLLM
jgi:Ran GTPase-activating protein (RanGAP) involved in mRNA processing and transport